jgi:mRNA interferase RelE/StbE
MERYASAGHGDVRKIRGHRGLFRLRSGVWRILFTPDTEARSLYVLAVSHHREAYRGD